MAEKKPIRKGGGASVTGLKPAPGDVWEKVRRGVRRGLMEPVKDAQDFSKRLGQLKRAYKQGDFNEPAQTACLNLYKYLRRIQPRHKADFWKAGTLVYELADSFNIAPEIKSWAASEGKTLYERQYKKWEADRKLLSSKPPESKALMREHVLFITCYGNEQKRRGEISEALEVFETLFDFTDKVLASDGMPCNATLAILSYHLGSIYRLREEHHTAEEMYLRALDFYYRRSMTRPGDLDEFFFVTRRVAMCVGLGLGWINLTRSYIQRAGHALATSRALMVHIPDPVVRSFIDMLYGTINRVSAGTDPAELGRAIVMLKSAHDEFEWRGHQRYRMHASYELALAYNLVGEFGEAERFLDYVEEHAANDKWRAKVHTLRSRIRRGEERLEEALSEAGRALSAARSSKLPLPVADAYITLGEVKFQLAERDRPGGATYADALRDFEKALDESQPRAGGVQAGNQKLLSVCLLHIAHCHIREGGWKEADAHLERWRELKPQVEHRWVLDVLAARVEQEFEMMTQDFVVPAGDHKKWDFRKRAEELQDWLLTQALRRTGDDVAGAALLLGYSENRVKQLLRGRRRRREKRKAVAGG